MRPSRPLFASLTLVALLSAVAVRADGRVVRLSQEDVKRLARPVLETALSPCTIKELSVQSALRLPRGDVKVSAEVTVPRRSGRVPARVVFAIGSTVSRMNASVTVECPAPLVQPGDRVSIVAYAGPVRASVPGEATQVGRVGDVIRVRNLVNGSSVMARVAPDGSVEVAQR